MSNEVCWLLTLTNGDHALKVALKTTYEKLPGEAWKYPLDPEFKPLVMALLPLHIREFGTIVDCEELFDVALAV